MLPYPESDCAEVTQNHPSCTPKRGQWNFGYHKRISLGRRSKDGCTLIVWNLRTPACLVDNQILQGEEHSTTNLPLFDKEGQDCSEL